MTDRDFALRLGINLDTDEAKDQLNALLNIVRTTFNQKFDLNLRTNKDALDYIDKFSEELNVIKNVGTDTINNVTISFKNLDNTITKVSASAKQLTNIQGTEVRISNIKKYINDINKNYNELYSVTKKMSMFQEGTLSYEYFDSQRQIIEERIGSLINLEKEYSETVEAQNAIRKNKLRIENLLTETSAKRIDSEISKEEIKEQKDYYESLKLAIDTATKARKQYYEVGKSQGYSESTLTGEIGRKDGLELPESVAYAKLNVEASLEDLDKISNGLLSVNKTTGRLSATNEDLTETFDKNNTAVTGITKSIQNYNEELDRVSSNIVRDKDQKSLEKAIEDMKEYYSISLKIKSLDEEKEDPEYIKSLKEKLKILSATLRENNKIYKDNERYKTEKDETSKERDRLVSLNKQEKKINEIKIATENATKARKKYYSVGKAQGYDVGLLEENINGKKDSKISESLKLAREEANKADEALKQLLGTLAKTDNETGELSVDMKELRKVFSDNEDAVKSLLSAINSYNDSVRKSKSDIQAEKDQKALDKAIKDMEEYYRLRTQAEKIKTASATGTIPEEYEKKLRDLRRILDTNTSAYADNKKFIDAHTEATKKADEEHEKLINNLHRLGDNFGTLGKKILTTAQNVLRYQVAWRALNLGEDFLTNSIQKIKELDKAMTDIQTVTNGTDEQTKRLMMSYSELAYKLGSTTHDVADASIEILRMGKTQKETEQILSASTMLSRLGMIDSAEATQYMTSTLNGFNIEAKDALEVVDKLTKLDLEYATSASEIATALRYVAASAGAAGFTLDQMSAMITITSDKSRRAAETIGQSFRTMIARLQNIKAQKFVDDETGEALNDVEKVLTKIGIRLRKDEHTWRSAWDVFNEIGSSWDTFNDVEKSAISTALGGTRQRENLIITFDNWNEVLQATSTSLNAAGTATEKYEHYLDGIEAKIAQFTAKWENFVIKTNKSDLFKSVVDLGEKAIDVVDFLTNDLNIMGKALADVFGIAIYKTIADKLNSIQKSSAGVIETIGSMFNPKVRAEGLAFQTMLSNIHSEIKKTTEGTFELFDTVNHTTIGTFKTMDELKTHVAQTGGELSKLQKISVGMQVAFSWVTAAVVAFQLLSLAVENYNRKILEGMANANESANKMKEENAEIESKMKHIVELNKKIDEGNLSFEEYYNVRKDIIETQDDLIKNYDIESDAVTSLTEDVNSLASAYGKVEKERATDFLKENRKAVLNAQKYLQNKRAIPSAFSVSSGTKNDYKKIINIIQSLGLEGWEFSPYSNIMGGHEMITRKSREDAIKELKVIQDAIVNMGDESIMYISDSIGEAIKEITGSEKYVESINVIENATKNYLIAAQSENLSNIESGYDKMLQAQIKYEHDSTDENKKSLDIAIENYRKYRENLISAIKKDTNIEIFGIDLDNIISYVNEQFEKLYKGGIDTFEDRLFSRQGETWIDKIKAGSVEAYDSLVEEAKKYGITQEMLNDILIKNGVILEQNNEEIAETSDTTERLLELIEESSTSYGELNDIINKYNNTGKISIDDLNKILEMSPKYISYIKRENGVLKLNKDALMEVVKAREAEYVIRKKSEIVDLVKGIEDETEALKVLRGELEKISVFSPDDIKIKEFLTQLKIEGKMDLYKEVIEYFNKIGELYNSVSLEENVGSKTKNKIDEALKHSEKYAEKLKDIMNMLKESDEKIAEIEDALSKASALGDLGDIKLYNEALLKENQNRKNILQQMLKETTDVLDEIKSKFHEFGSVPLTEVDIAQYKENIQNQITALKNANKGSDDTTQNDLAIQGLEQTLQRFEEFVSGYREAEEQQLDIKRKINEADLERINIIQAIKDNEIQQYENLYKELERMRDLDLISEKDFYELSVKLTENAFKNKEHLAKEYADKMVDISEWQKEITEKEIEVYERELDVLAEKNEQINETVSNISPISSSVNDQVWGFLGGNYEEQISVIDKIIAKLYELAEAKKAALLGAGQSNEDILLNEELKDYVDKINEYKDKIDDIYLQQYENRLSYFEEYMSKQELYDNLTLEEQADMYMQMIKYTDDYYAQMKLSDKEYYEHRSDLVDKYIKAQQDLAKKQTEDRIDELEKQKDAMEDILDLVIDMIKQEKEAEKERHKQAIDDFKKEAEERKKLLDEQSDERNYQQELNKKAKAVSDLEKKLAALRLDTSGKNAVEISKTEEELAKAREELEDYQYENSIEKQKDAIDKEVESFEEKEQEKIDIIDKYLDEEGTIRQEAINRLQNEWDTLYKKLLEYNRVYGTGVDTDIKNAWDVAKQALEGYGNAQKDVLETMKDIANEIEKLKDFDMSDVVIDVPSPHAPHGPDTDNGIYDNEEHIDLDGGNSTDREKILNKMKENARLWHETDDPAEKERLKNQNKIYGEQLGLTYDPASGIWYEDSNKTIRAFKHGGATKMEGLAYLHKNEAILNAEQSNNILKRMSLTSGTPAETLYRLANSGMSSVYENAKTIFGDIMPITVNGSLDNSVLPDIRSISNEVIKQLNTGLRFNGAKRNVRSYSL